MREEWKEESGSCTRAFFGEFHLELVHKSAFDEPKSSEIMISIDYYRSMKDSLLGRANERGRRSRVTEERIEKNIMRDK